MSSTPDVALDHERALRESEARLQQIVDNTTAIVFAKDRDGRYILVNREFERLVQRSASEIVGRVDREIFPHETAAAFRHNDLRVLLERRAIEFEETGTFHGRERTFLASKFPLLDAEGVPYAVCAIATDISERKRIERALSSAALAVSTSHGENLFVELTRYLTAILDVECAFVAAFDAHPEPKLHMLALCIDGEVRERFDYPFAGTACETVIGHGFRIYPSRLFDTFPLDNDFRAMGFDSYAGYPLNDSQGRPLGVIAAMSRQRLERHEFVESVLKIFAVRASAELERMQSDAALRASEESYRGIFEASDEAIFVHDWDTGAILDVNPKACKAYGYTHEEMLKLSVEDVSSGVPPYNAEGARRVIEEAKERGYVRVEWHRKNKDGSLHWDEVHLSSATIGGERRVLAFTREITERKQAEERRQRLEAQLRQAQKMEAIGQLAGGIAHDFNNLLTTIMGYVVLALERQTALEDARLSSYLEKARESCERARGLIEQMLMFSRGQRGAPRPLALAPLVEQSLALLRPSIPEGVALRTVLDADAPAVMLDPVQLEQVLMNLCLNARDALNGAGSISVLVRSTGIAGGVCTACRQPVEGTFVELAVADDGPGIVPEVVERIFEPFFSTKEVGRGAGMGLATLHGIVHEHDGHVVVETSPGDGATFRVLFPALAHGEGATSFATSVAPGGPAIASLRGTVLVVDDEQAVGEFMRELLGTWGLDAACVSSGRAAFDLVAENPTRFDLVISDYAMPRMNGIELARALRSLRAELPVVLYSGFGDRIARPEAELAGVKAVLPKPVQPQQLAAVLVEHLRAG